MTPLSREDAREELLELLLTLDGVRQDAFHHPEGDALYHSLQVLEHALAATDDPCLWAAALLHDVGKGVDQRWHAEVGAELLTDLMPGRVVWLVRHHLDLLYRPRRARRRWRGTPLLRQLRALRSWDEAGRELNAFTRPVEDAVDLVLDEWEVLRLTP